MPEILSDCNKVKKPAYLVLVPFEVPDVIPGGDPETGPIVVAVPAVLLLTPSERSKVVPEI